MACFGRNICRAVTESHLANLPKDFSLPGVNAALSLRAAMFKPVLRSQWSAGGEHGLPWGLFVGDVLETS